MERKGLVVGAAALMVVLLMLSPNGGDQGVTVAMARTCESQSHQFSGGCVSDHNCGVVCHDEGFTDGRCRGFRRRCFCTRPC